jgi:hypothetical protein
MDLASRSCIKQQQPVDHRLAVGGEGAAILQPSQRRDCGHIEDDRANSATIALQGCRRAPIPGVTPAVPTVGAIRKSQSDHHLGGLGLAGLDQRLKQSRTLLQCQPPKLIDKLLKILRSNRRLPLKPLLRTYFNNLAEQCLKQSYSIRRPPREPLRKFGGRSTATSQPLTCRFITATFKVMRPCATHLVT